MKKLVSIILISSFLFGFNTQKIKNLMGEENYQNYSKLLDKIFTKDSYDIYEILKKLKNNGLLELFFDKAKLIHTRFIFDGGDNILNTKILNDSLYNLGYYYYYYSNVDKVDDRYSIEIEFKSEHYIDPVSLIDEFNTRGCKVEDVYKIDKVFHYIFNCQNGIIKEAKQLTQDNQRFINSKGIYWLINDNFKTIKIKTKKIDFWHPSVWFYDKNLNLINNYKKNKKTTILTLAIPTDCKYIKITDMYSGENFKRGIIIKGLK